MDVGWKEWSAVVLLVLFLGAVLVLALEHGLNPEESCPNCLRVTRPDPQFDFFTSCGTMGTNRICPGCGRRWWSNESSIVYVVRRTRAWRP